ncbi:glycosyltransferase family 2 protein [Rudanella lutea]|uniref:glycosyltransferase family 2 protein n=1 Tax=Rudanella lutea TaxID=451374 RepID=UPI000365C7AC|nr:glycosyltransferase family 2 protein [Rudanella lutea]
MKVSIITVVYNGVSTVRDCLESVLGQSYPDIEYIVVDGGSTDGTVELIREYGTRISRFVTEPDKGLYDAMNKGISMATGDVIGFLNSDDLYRHTEVVKHVVERFKQTGSDAVYSDMVYVDRYDISKVKRYWKAGSYRPGDFLWGWMPGHLSFFARKSVYDAYGHFRLDLRSAADYELMLRFIHKHNISLSYLPETTVIMREGGVSNANLKNRVRANQEDRMAWEMNELKPYFFTLTLKPLRKIVQLFQRERPSVS